MPTENRDDTIAASPTSEWGPTLASAIPAGHGHVTTSEFKIRARDVNVFYGEKQALFDVSLDVPAKAVTAFIGPSGCGKSTFLRCINRMNDTIPSAKVAGSIEIDGERRQRQEPSTRCCCARASAWCSRSRTRSPRRSSRTSPTARKHPRPGHRARTSWKPSSRAALKRAGLWNEVSDRLHQPGTGLSGGQQQRLVIARAIAVSPEVILMDEPCSALDPIATAKIEELIDELRSQYCIVIVTHSMAQAARVSQKTAFFHLGKLVESGPTEEMFTNPRDTRTQDYITGRFG